MKRSVVFLFCLIAAYCCNAQASKFIGNWQGKLNVGIDLRIIFHIKQDSTGTFNTTLDSPDQSAFGIKADKTAIAGDSVSIEMNKLQARFFGTFLNDSVIAGTFIQGREISLELKKTDKVIALNRPQTPHPPFAYKSEDIEYDNPQKSLHYGATITIPQGHGLFPAAVMITGSGAQNRDEEISGHKLFAVIADYLTKRGFIVLRVDDRGVGKSTGDFERSTSMDFANDVNVAIDYLKSRPEVDIKRIGMIGHSEGGMIAPIVAAQRADIDFIVLLAGPGIKITELMTEQNVAILRSGGISEDAINAYIPLFKKMTGEIMASADTASALKTVQVTLRDWIENTSDSLVTQLGLEDQEGQEGITTTFVKAYSTPWFKYFLGFDPQPYLQKLSTKVLALNGSKDIQVIPGSNLAGIEEALKKSKSKVYEVKVIPGLNHLFQDCTKCTVEEYGQLEETFSPAALKIMGDWLEKNVKSK